MTEHQCCGVAAHDKRGLRAGIALSIAALLAGCAAVATPEPTAQVPAARETEAVASRGDAADDPAIWRNPADPGASLIVATDKKAGLFVYGLNGAVRSSLPAGRVNNVDLRDGVAFDGGPGVLVGASDRSDLAAARIALYRLDPDRGQLQPVGAVEAGAGEAYGFCLWRRREDAAVFAFLVMKNGQIVQARLDLAGGAVRGEIVRRVKLATQSEGCVADDRTGLLYVGEEMAGVWRLSAAPDATEAPVLFAAADGRRLVTDVEGVAIAPEGESGGLLIVSSQGDSAYAAYRLEDGAYVGRFRIGPGPDGIGGTSETDGIEIALGDFGSDFPEGLMIAQDGDNAPKAQNFKMVDWREVRRALGL
ncbi:MAG: phytase [Phenylobacterium sp.]|uniref:phytase n=1 Tax=Phenylobacterium sp. TaxID=1871053 RepID=UPI00391A545F